jgi:hypothetical protein
MAILAAVIGQRLQLRVLLNRFRRSCHDFDWNAKCLQVSIGSPMFNFLIFNF